MTGKARKLAFQLTPLLDLLLIVIFAQYMEMEQQSQSVQAEAQERLREAEQALATLRALRADERAGQQREGPELTELRAENERLRQQEAALQESLRLAAEQRDRLGQLMTELFRVPEDVVRQVLPHEVRSPVRRSVEETERLREQFREIGRMRVDEAVRHMLSYDELRKRADVWEIFIDEDGLIHLDMGERQWRFRVTSAEEFSRELFQRYKAAPQPKGLVVILLSWEALAPAGPRQYVETGMREIVDRMRADSADRTRFEYALIGIRPRISGSAAAQ